MITMKRFLIIFLVSVCGSLALLAQSTTGVRTFSDVHVKSKGATASTPITAVGGGSSARSSYSSVGGGGSVSGGISTTPLFYRSNASTSSANSQVSLNNGRLSNLRTPLSGTLPSLATYRAAVLDDVAGGTGTTTTVSGPNPLNDNSDPADGRGDGFISGGSRPKLPIGDAVLPLLLMAAAYACFRLRRRTVKA